MATHKLTILIPGETKAEMDAIKEARDMSYTEQIRRAIRLWKHLCDLGAAGAEFRVYENDRSYSVIRIND